MAPRVEEALFLPSNVATAWQKSEAHGPGLRAGRCPRPPHGVRHATCSSGRVAFERIQEMATAQLARYKLRRCAWVGRRPRVTGRVWVHGQGVVLVGDRVCFDAAAAPIELYAWPGAIIVVGDDSYLGGGTSLEATASIRLGARTRVGAFCRIMDNHFHALVGDRSVRPPPRPVVFGDDVVLGPRSIVLAGASPASGSRFADGTVVKRMGAPAP